MINAVKHSGINRPEDGTICLSVRVDPSGVTLQVTDTGKGFDTDQKMQESDIPSGLTRLKELAESSDIQLDVWSKEGKGTRLLAELKLATAGQKMAQGEERSLAR
jgi:anti-sigma regulatory factor (Ser/Thr protein kinase)